MHVGVRRSRERQRAALPAGRKSLSQESAREVRVGARCADGRCAHGLPGVSEESPAERVDGGRSSRQHGGVDSRGWCTMSRTPTVVVLAIVFLTCFSWVVPTDLIA